MRPGNKTAYDVVIIGAGISGLVCGCYLARAGKKVLLLEQHNRPGGYCTSFKRAGFTFDAAVHAFGSYRDGGIMNKIVRDLGLETWLTIKRSEPSNIIISPDYKISFWSDINRTIEELQRAFPSEAGGIKNFFHFLLNFRPFDLATLRNRTFEDFLKQYFLDKKLASIISFPMLGISGLPSSLIAAFTAIMLYTEFYIDGGYYPEGGMQALPDALAKKCEELGGELKLSCGAKKIRVRYNKIEGVVLDNEEFIPSKYVISCCDARQTFFKLLGCRVVNKEFLNHMKELMPSPSFLIAYLGVDEYVHDLCTPGATISIMPDYKTEERYLSYIMRKNVNTSSAFMIHVPPDKKSFQALVVAAFKNKQYWINNKYFLLESFIKRIDHIFPGFSKHIVYKDAGTPQTLCKYTSNYKGASYGWASIPSQLFIKGLTQATSIEGLYLSGHWTTQRQGIAGVAYLGYETSKLILKREKMK